MTSSSAFDGSAPQDPGDRDPGLRGSAVGPREPAQRRPNRRDRRRQRMAAEIQRSRSGDHRVPTWVMAAALLVIVGAWLALIYLS
jgi:hypothetical protein